MSDLTFRVTFANTSRSVPEADFFQELAVLERNHFVGVGAGPVTIEAVDERGRICWRAYYKSFRALARELVQEQKGVFGPK
jgi:hypothetical protein